MPGTLETESSTETANADAGPTLADEIARVKREAAESIERMEAKNRQLLDEYKQVKQKLGGLSEGEIQDLLKLKEDTRKAKEQQAREIAEAKGNWEKVEAQMRSQWDERETGYKQTVKTLSDQLEEEIFINKATAAIIKAGGEPAVMLPHFASRKEFYEEEGRKNLRILSANGGPMVGPEGQPATLEDLALEFRSNPVFAPNFKGSGASGASVNPGAASHTPGSGNPFETGNLTEIAQIRRDNPARYEELRRTTSKPHPDVRALMGN